MAIGNTAFHVLNRGVRRSTLFFNDGDYQAFENVLCEAVRRRPGIRLLSYIIMPNHWHLVVWPREDDDLPEFMRWLTVTHALRWHAAHQTLGTGPVYQGRYKAFAAQCDDHLLSVLRYCERNALRAKLTRRAEAYRWCSLWRRINAAEDQTKLLSPWPMACPKNWADMMNHPQSDAELQVIRKSIRTAIPYGGDRWRASAAKKLGIELHPKPRGRPRKLLPVPI